MTPEERVQLKDKIESAIARLKVDIKDLEEITQPIELSNTIGRLSRMDAINNKSVAEKTLQDYRAKLTRLEYSLSRAETDAFGKCSSCQAEIQFGRLMFMPDSIKCIRCARR